MAGNIEVEVRGLGDLIERCTMERIGARPLRGFFQAATRFIAASAKGRVRRLTGAMADAIGTRQSRARVPTFGAVAVRPRAHYWRFQEFGTTRGVTPSHAFATSLDASMGEVRSLLDGAARLMEQAWHG